MLMVKVRPDVALAFNYFVMIMERLCRVSHDNPMQEECTQLLVPVVWGGAFHWSAWGYHFVFILMQVNATQYPKAVLHFSKECTVSSHILSRDPRVEIPTDQGTLFMSCTQEELLGIKPFGPAFTTLRLMSWWTA